METPYRCQRLIEELIEHASDRMCILGLNLTQPEERLVRSFGKNLAAHGPFTDAEPIALLLPRQ